MGMLLHSLTAFTNKAKWNVTTSLHGFLPGLGYSAWLLYSGYSSLLYGAGWAGWKEEPDMQEILQLPNDKCEFGNQNGISSLRTRQTT